MQRVAAHDAVPVAKAESLRIKVCGIETEADLVRLDCRRVDLAGIPVGDGNRPFGISRSRAAALLRLRTAHVKPVVVTLAASYAALDELVQALQPGVIQLHGFDPPACAARLKLRYHGSLEVLKVLHFQADGCIERDLLRRYVDAGIDGFVLDTFLSPTRAGSTGHPIDLRVARRVMAMLGDVPCLVAGGVGWWNVQEIRTSLRPAGVDVDSGVKRGRCLDDWSLDRLVATARMDQ